MPRATPFPARLASFCTSTTREEHSPLSPFLSFRFSSDRCTYIFIYKPMYVRPYTHPPPPPHTALQPSDVPFSSYSLLTHTPFICASLISEFFLGGPRGWIASFYSSCTFARSLSASFPFLYHGFVSCVWCTLCMSLSFFFFLSFSFSLSVRVCVFVPPPFDM